MASLAQQQTRFCYQDC